MMKILFLQIFKMTTGSRLAPVTLGSLWYFHEGACSQQADGTNGSMQTTLFLLASDSSLHLFTFGSICRWLTLLLQNDQKEANEESQT